MPRWDPDAPGRLQQAALELYAERGFEATTATQIAARAGLTRRTFFRYFPDKREVLFWGSDILQQWWLSAIEAAAPDTAPLEVIRNTLHYVAAQFEQRRSAILLRQQVLDSSPELRERERTKLALLVDAVANALESRGLAPQTARIAATVAVAIEHLAFTRWIEPPNQTKMRDHIDTTISELQHLFASHP